MKIAQIMPDGSALADGEDGTDSSRWFSLVRW